MEAAAQPNGPREATQSASLASRPFGSLCLLTCEKHFGPLSLCVTTIVLAITLITYTTYVLTGHIPWKRALCQQQLWPQHRAQPCRCNWRFEKEVRGSVQDYQGHLCQAWWGGWYASQCRGLTIIFKLAFKCVVFHMTCLLVSCMTDILRQIIHNLFTNRTRPSRFLMARRISLTRLTDQL